jgi:hypothetical protein
LVGASSKLLLLFSSYSSFVVVVVVRWSPTFLLMSELAPIPPPPLPLPPLLLLLPPPPPLLFVAFVFCFRCYDCDGVVFVVKVVIKGVTKSGGLLAVDPESPSVKVLEHLHTCFVGKLCGAVVLLCCYAGLFFVWATLLNETKLSCAALCHVYHVVMLRSATQPIHAMLTVAQSLHCATLTNHASSNTHEPQSRALSHYPQYKCTTMPPV